MNLHSYDILWYMLPFSVLCSFFRINYRPIVIMLAVFTVKSIKQRLMSVCLSVCLSVCPVFF